jgi:hypothetical protein
MNEQVRWPWDALIRRLPFTIMLSGLGVLVFLRGQRSAEITMGRLTAAIALVAMYGTKLWANKSSTSKALWHYGILLVFLVSVIFVAPP